MIELPMSMPLPEITGLVNSLSLSLFGTRCGIYRDDLIRNAVRRKCNHWGDKPFVTVMVAGSPDYLLDGSAPSRQDD